MNQSKISRRALIARACQVPALGALVFVASCGSKKPVSVCADPEQLSASDESLRASVQYTDDTPDAAQPCRDCAYFSTVAHTAECGHCEILGGPVSVTGHCTSWSARK